MQQRTIRLQLADGQEATVCLMCFNTGFRKVSHAVLPRADGSEDPVILYLPCKFCYTLTGGNDEQRRGREAP
jgi:hypothetical protein